MTNIVPTIDDLIRERALNLHPYLNPRQRELWIEGYMQGVSDMINAQIQAPPHAH